MVVGSVEVIPVEDARGSPGTFAEFYSDVPAEAWEPYRALYPELFAGERWRLPCRSYVLRSRGRTILVDTGVGPPGIWTWQPEYEGRLLASLETAGVAPDDVDVVLLSHLHVDHVGWNTDADGRVVFARARFVLHRHAADAVPGRVGPDRPHIARCIVPLLDGGLVDEVAGDIELAQGIVAIELPGHDVGHMGVRIASDRSEAVLFVDSTPHPAFLDEPGWRFDADLDHAAAEATRRALIEELRDRDTLAVSGHYPGNGIGRVVTRGGRTVWEAA